MKLLFEGDHFEDNYKGFCKKQLLNFCIHQV